MVKENNPVLILYIRCGVLILAIDRLKGHQNFVYLHFCLQITRYLIWVTRGSSMMGISGIVVGEG